MIKEYQSIMKNDVWEIVLRLEKKYVMSSKWIYKINHVVYGSIIQGKILIMRLLTERRHRLRREIFTRGEVHFP